MSAKQVLALLSSHLEGNEDQFLSIALQVAAQEARSGRIEDADKLKKLVQRVRDANLQPSKVPVPLARPKGELQGLVHASYPKDRLAEMVLSKPVETMLKSILEQQQQRNVLRDHGLKPSTHVLLVGPPGTGKTMTASALAGELRLPLFKVKVEAIFSRYLGETSNKLRLLFDQISETRGVYLLDEFDSLGAKRGDSNDIGEMRRVLTSILQFMEEPNSTDSVVIASTNHSEILDDALARRFDEVIEYELPDRNLARAIVQQRLGNFKFTPGALGKLTSVLDGLSPGEIVKATDSAVKDAILSRSNNVTLSELKKSLENRRKIKERFYKKS